MNKLGLAQVLGTLVVSTILGALPACYGDVPDAQQGDAAEAPTQPSALVGKWQFVYDQTARTRVETQIAASTASLTEREDAKVAAEKEAAASQIEFTDDGDFFSWVEGELVLQARYVADPATHGEVRLSMNVEGQDKSTTVAVHGDDEIVMNDPRKGPLTFRRVK